MRGLRRARRSDLLAFPEPSARPGGRIGKYVYLHRPDKEPRRSGRSASRSPAEVHTVSFKDIAAVSSPDTPLGLRPTRENVLAHERFNDSSCATSR